MSDSLYIIIRVHSRGGVRQTIGTAEVLFGNSLSWLLNNTYILCVYGIKIVE